jgi:hypothetical protein
LKLNQVIAVLQTVKANSTKAKTAVYHQIQKSALFQGISRTFSPAQVKESSEDVPEGTWRTVKFSGNFNRQTKRTLAASR